MSAYNSGWKAHLRRLARRFGYDLVGFNPLTHPVRRRMALMDALRIDLVLDVGANVGQYGSSLRSDFGYTGEIWSYEPVGEAFRQIEQRTNSDPRWKAHRLAIGATDCEININVSGNSVGSSFLQPSRLLHQKLPEAGMVRSELVQCRSLDSLLLGDLRGQSGVWLKIDTQGYEAEVLRGAQALLPHICAVQIEMPLVPLYEGALDVVDAINLMRQSGFDLCGLEPGFADQATGQLFETDGIFVRRGFASR